MRVMRDGGQTTGNHGVPRARIVPSALEGVQATAYHCGEASAGGPVMSRTDTAIYDGKVFRPTEPLDLPADAAYRLTIDEQPTNGAEGAPPRAVQRMIERATDLGLPPDLAAQHDHYLYGSPKR
jgi:hypothetical protein